MPIPRLLTGIAAMLGLATAVAIGYLALQPPVPLLSNARFDSAQISPDADGIEDITTIRYSLARSATVSIYLQSETGDRYLFRDAQPRTPGDYSVLFSGVVDGFVLPGESITGTIERRLMPFGRYTWTIEATEQNGKTQRVGGTLDIVGTDASLPIISAFEIHPPVFSPNQDGVDDRVNINVFLAKPAQLSVFLQDNTGMRYYLSEREGGRDPGDMGNHEFDYDGGVDQEMEPPPDGTYAVYAVAQDAIGQRIVREGQLTLIDGGLPQAEIAPQVTGAAVFFARLPYREQYFTSLEVSGERIAKPEGVASELDTITLAQGDLLVFKLTVHNYGSTPIRTAGPFPGTVYQFTQRSASLGEYEESGAWRVGINCDTAFSDFPWRWALAPLEELRLVTDQTTGKTYYYLEPGQRAEVWGAVRMTEILEARNPQDCWAGLIHEDVGIPAFQSRVGAREIEIVSPSGPQN